MPLNFMKKKVPVGIDIGHHTIKVVAVQRVGPGWRLTNVGTSPMPAGAVKEGIIVDIDGVANSIKAAMHAAGVSGSNAAISVAGGSVVMRQVRIPAMPELMLRRSIRFEAGRYVPGNVEESYIEFEILGHTNDGNMDVMIVAAPKEIVESRIQACEKAGLVVDAVDLEPFAASRSTVEMDIDHNWFSEAIALVDIGAQNTNVSVVNKGQFAMTRTIPQGGYTMTQALKSYFKLSDEDAENGKMQLDLSELLQDKAPRENPPLRVLQPHADEVIREMRRSLNYFQSQQTEAGENTPVTTLVVSGGGAYLKGLPEYLGAKLGLNEVTLGVFDNPRFTYSGDHEAGKGLELAVATGLAMRPFLKAA